MIDFFNWFLSFVASFMTWLFSILSIDGYSFGYMLLAIAIIGVVMGATIGVLGVAHRALISYRRL